MGDDVGVYNSCGHRTISCSGLLGDDVGVYNSCGHRTISCSGLFDVPSQNRAEIVGKS